MCDGLRAMHLLLHDTTKNWKNFAQKNLRPIYAQNRLDAQGVSAVMRTLASYVSLKMQLEQRWLLFKRKIERRLTDKYRDR